MTIFGPDVSSYEDGLNVAALRDASFIFAKCSEGTYYTDADYPGWRSQAAALGKPFAWYHFLSGEDAAAQVRHTLACVGDPHLPGMLDVENEDVSRGTFRPTFAQALAYVDAAHAAGLNLRLVYLPHWMWQQMGSPDLTPLSARGVYLVSSAYPGGPGSAPAVYPGDSAAGWQGYGGVTPLLYQFTNQASDGGRTMDYNAFRGSVAQFTAYMQMPGPDPVPDPAPPVTPSTNPEDDMPAFATGKIDPGAGAVTVVCPPPANMGAAGWGNVWFSLGCDFGDCDVRVAVYTHGAGWSEIDQDIKVSAAGDRVNPHGGPLPTGVQKISITRGANPGVPLSYLIEATHR